MSLSYDIENIDVSKGEVAIFWLGQAGFLFKTHTGVQIAVDPYLTNCGERIRGFKRLSPMLISPEEFNPDYYITTHLHFDHYDYEAIPVIAKNDKTVFFGPQSCITEYEKLDLAKNRYNDFSEGKQYTLDDSIKITAIFADHGTLEPNAVGVLIKIDENVIYISGDTAFHQDELEKIAKFKPNLAVLSINGQFGNLTAEEGANAAKILGVHSAIPCHFWTFTQHKGEPHVFHEILAEDKDCDAIFMRQGECVILTKDSVKSQIA